MNFLFRKNITDTDDELENTDETELEFEEDLSTNNNIKTSSLSTNFFQYDVKKIEYKQINEYDIMNNVCICMIDIYSFSSWCSNQIPHIIATTMIEYNKLICNTIKKYNSLRKIELVGDSCMIISGYDDSSKYMDNCLESIRFAVDLLKQVKHIQNIFKSKFIGIRIGIHLSDVIGVYIEDPNKYQLFGNDINICSRLEASTKPNTMHISEKTLMVVQDMCNNTCSPCTKCIKGDCIKQEYKGVGTKTSYIYYLKVDKPLFINFDEKTSKLFSEAIQCYDYDFEVEFQLSALALQSYKYVCIFINLFTSSSSEECSKFLEGILKLDYRNVNPYFIILLKDESIIDEVKRKFPYSFDEYINVNDTSHTEQCKSILKTCKSSFECKRGSLDLHIIEKNAREKIECSKLYH